MHVCEYSISNPAGRADKIVVLQNAGPRIKTFNSAADAIECRFSADLVRISVDLMQISADECRLVQIRVQIRVPLLRAGLPLFAPCFSFTSSNCETNKLMCGGCSMCLPKPPAEGAMCETSSIPFPHRFAAAPTSGEDSLDRAAMSMAAARACSPLSSSLPSLPPP